MVVEHGGAIYLTLNKVGAIYGARTVLRDISLTIQHGEVLVVTGPNGSGKSTLLRLLCGLQRPSQGAVYYMWQGCTFMPRDASHLFGWVAPDLMLYRELSARENLRFFAAVRGVACSNEQIDYILERVGLRGRGDDLIASYSSGMVHRLRYAHALLHKPPVLLLDEPTVMLDTAGTDVVEAIVEQQRKHGITVLATNDQREQRFGDYLLTLENR
jgi:heme exporter protein A